jgi:DNA helicase-2/ATP-dependent DNA helicase PcrA
LFYVAITSAEKRLFLSYANTRFKWGQYIDTDASRFLLEIDERFTEKKETEEKKNYKIFPKRKTTFQQKQTKINSRLKKVNLSRLEVSGKRVFDLNIGTKVKHSIFGVGKVMKIDGENQNQKAIIFFKDHGQKQLLLKFAKLEIIK